MKRKIISCGIFAVSMIVLLFGIRYLLLTYHPDFVGYYDDEAVLSNFKNDEQAAEFVLDEIYYQLPVELSAFTDEGWKPVYVSDYLHEDTILLPNEYQKITYEKEGSSITLCILNQTSDDMRLGDNNISVVGIEVWRSNLKNKADIITKCGIYLMTSEAHIDAVSYPDIVKEFDPWRVRNPWYRLYREDGVPILYIEFGNRDRLMKIYDVVLRKYREHFDASALYAKDDRLLNDRNTPEVILGYDTYYRLPVQLETILKDGGEVVNPNSGTIVLKPGEYVDIEYEYKTAVTFRLLNLTEESLSADDGRLTIAQISYREENDAERRIEGNFVTKRGVSIGTGIDVIQDLFGTEENFVNHFYDEERCAYLLGEKGEYVFCMKINQNSRELIIEGIDEAGYQEYQ